MIQSPEFLHWFAGSMVTNQMGVPLVTYRGEHGPVQAELPGSARGATQTKLGSITFGSARAASRYAMYPNSDGDFPSAPRVTAAFLSIKNPFMNRPSDPFVELEEISEALGFSEAKIIAMQFRDHIEHTNNWCDNIGCCFDSYEQYSSSASFNIGDIYFNAYALFDDQLCVDLLKAAGFDGAIYGGCGETFAETEYRVFRNEQIWNQFAISRN